MSRHAVGPDQERVWIARSAEVIVSGSLNDQAKSVVAGKVHGGGDVRRRLSRDGVRAVLGHIRPPTSPLSGSSPVRLQGSRGCGSCAAPPHKTGHHCRGSKAPRAIGLATAANPPGLRVRSSRSGLCLARSLRAFLLVNDSLIYTLNMTPRQPARDRLPELVEAALRVFTVRG